MILQSLTNGLITLVVIWAKVAPHNGSIVRVKLINIDLNIQLDCCIINL